LALSDLRAEAAEAVLPLLAVPRFAHAELALEVLTWSRDARVGPALIEWAIRRVPMVRRAQHRRRTAAPRRSSLPPDVPYKAILHALRGHPSDRTESFLVLGSRDWDPLVRAAALSSLGWWEPVERAEVLLCLQEGRRDANADVRQAARAALARLGERQALQWFRHGLISAEPQRMLETIQGVAAEGLTLLWPDLDHLADSEDLEISLHAREALERMGEDLERSRR
jgi:HEAT repeat protein